MASILIIIPYFGKLPDTFPFWYHSARNNHDVHFLFITDCDVEEGDNFKVLKMSFAELKERFDKALDMEVSLPSPYKLCDFKPVHGYVFAEEARGYDFWGFGDIDVVYGKIRHFFTDEILSRYDMLNGWGHLTLYRNNEFCNTFFMKRHGDFMTYTEAFTRPEYSCFDEYYGGCSQVWDTFYPDRVYHCESCLDDVRIQSRCEHFKSEFAEERNCLTFIYENENLYRVYFDKRYRRHKEPTLYAHFQKRYNWKIDVDDYSNYVVYPDVFRRPFRFLQAIRLTWLGRSKTAHWI